MDLSGVAAALALLSIPVSVLIARWQMRTALAQSEANHRAAMQLAKANHRAALEVVDANHQKAKEAAVSAADRPRVRRRSGAASPAALGGAVRRRRLLLGRVSADRSTGFSF